MQSSVFLRTWNKISKSGKRSSESLAANSGASNGLDEFLRRVDEVNNDAELREVFKTFELTHDTHLPEDPFSAEYRDHQLALYRRLHGEDYVVANEASNFDPIKLARKPFPFVHESAALVGDQLMGIGHLIKAMDLPAGARILEFGPGWGNTTITLAKMGYHVTALDIESNFVALLEERAKLEGISTLTVRQGQFFDIETLPADSFDAILFYECFHHCDDHLRLMAGFDRVLDANGIVCFAAEPINDQFPIPWGLRMDGESLWAICKNGWLELGFHTSYFNEAMARFGWMIELRQGTDSPLSCVRIAKRLDERQLAWDIRQGRFGSQVGTSSDSGITASGEDGYLMYGPYETLAPGKYEARIDWELASDPSGTLIVDVAVNKGTEVLARREIALEDGQVDDLTLAFKLEVLAEDLEVRVYSAGGAGVTLLRLAIVPEE